MRTLKISLLVFILSITISAQQQWFWQNPLPQGNTLHSVQLVYENVGWAVGDGGTILKTTNGGFSWIFQSISEPYILNAVSFTSLYKGFIIGWKSKYFYTDGVFLKTTDGGQNWISHFISSDKLYGLSFLDDNNGIVVE